MRHNKNEKTSTQWKISHSKHSDIIGPIPKSIMGYQYILTFIDEYSRKGWTFLLKSKAEAIDNIISFINYANNLFSNYKIKYFISDQGKEYTSRKIKKFCNKYGIKKVFSPPYNPENNGIAERFNQTIITAAKTILFWSKLSTNFWDFAIKYAKYIYNLTPHSGIDFSIPNELFFNRRATIKHIKVFGCIAFYKNFSQQKHKLDPNYKNTLEFNQNSNNIHSLENVYTKNFSPKNDQQFIKYTIDLPSEILEEIQSLIPQKRPLSPINSSIISNKLQKSIHENKYFIDSITNNTTENPKTYNNAIKSKNADKWLKAIKDELSNLYNNKTMTFVKFVPKNKNIITTKWAFSVKKDANNHIIKFKARLVARGYDQIFGIDYELTYSPTLNTDNIKLIISLASIFEWKILQLDIKSAYLNAPLDKEIYTTIPIGDPNFGKGY